MQYRDFEGVWHEYERPDPELDRSARPVADWITFTGIICAFLGEVWLIWECGMWLARHYGGHL